MIEIAHLLDDFGMGGVTRALTLFDEPALKSKARSKVVRVHPSARVAPQLDAEIVVDHMALSWARLVFLASLRARNPRARIVHVEHSYTRSFETNMVESRKRFRTMIKLAATLFDDIVCVSVAQGDWLANEVGVAPKKLRVIYPWTDRSELFDIAPKASETDGPVQLLAYGRYAPVKNFGQLIEAMRFFKPDEIQLTIFGDGPDQEKLEVLAKDTPNATVLGPCSEPGLHLSACDAVVLPSRYEAFGLVATEARMAGRPILVADVDGLPEQAVDGGIVAPMGDAESIEAAIRLVLREDLAALGAMARVGVLGQNDAIVRGWEDIFAANIQPRTDLGQCGAQESSRRPVT